MTGRIGGKIPHKLRAQVQDPLGAAELNTSPEGTLKRDTNIMPREVNTPLCTHIKMYGQEVTAPRQYVG
jgi:hypothetical protein